MDDPRLRIRKPGQRERQPCLPGRRVIIQDVLAKRAGGWTAADWRSGLALAAERDGRLRS